MFFLGALACILSASFPRSFVSVLNAITLDQEQAGELTVC
jgi:hypothetical protein